MKGNEKKCCHYEAGEALLEVRRARARPLALTCVLPLVSLGALSASEGSLLLCCGGAVAEAALALLLAKLPACCVLPRGRGPAPTPRPGE